MIEFYRTISKAEVDSRYLNLKDDSGRRYGSYFPPHATKLIIVDDQERRFNSSKHHEHQIWGNIKKWFETNNISQGTRILVKFDPDSKVNGDYVVKLVIDKIGEPREIKEERIIEENNDYEEPKKIEIPIEFERQLESFLEKNLHKLESGLRLYKDEAGNPGRQYPTDIGPIDLLSVDKDGNLVVVELKKGRSSDAAVGQIQRYMGWVKQNLCKTNQSVFGIIVTHEFDAKLKYSAFANDKLKIRYYKIYLDFVSEENIEDKKFV